VEPDRPILRKVYTVSIFIVTASIEERFAGGDVPKLSHVPRTAWIGVVKVSTQAVNRVCDG